MIFSGGTTTFTEVGDFIGTIRSPLNEIRGSIDIKFIKYSSRNQ
jgi:hypothetical protein